MKIMASTAVENDQFERRNTSQYYEQLWRGNENWIMEGGKM